MAKEAGRFVLLQVSTGSPTGFVTVAGQQSTEFSGGTQTDDTTDKSAQGWGSTLNVLRNATVNAQGKANWPDLTGLDLIRAAWEAGSDIECKLLLNSSGAHYRGFFQVTQFNVSGTHSNATEYSLALANNGALTYSAT
jgi:predicted secreted protein